MAKNNEVAARVRITIGGVEASKKNLEALQTSSEQLSTSLNKLKKQEVKLIQENDVKGAAEVVKEQRKIEAALKSTKEMIRLQEAELNNYTNILDNLAQQPLTNLQKGLRDLQNQMKQTLTMNDIKRYGELRQAYNEVLQAVDQLSGKVPNLTYVLKNVGQVANKTLSESVSYLEKLIASTDKTTKEGRANIKKWTTELKTLRKETESRAIKVLEKPEEYAVEQIRQAVNDLKSLQSSLKLNKTGIKTWDEYVQKIKQAETYLDSYNQKQKETEAATRRAQTEKVLANPLASDVTTAQLQEAIKHGKELQAQLEHMGPEWEDYAKKIKVAEERLDEYNKTQKQAAEDAKALAEQQKAIDAINAKDTIRTATGTYNITTDEAKARVESIKQYMGGLNMSTQIDEIQRAKEALEVYEAALGKVKEELVDVSAVLKDPKNFSIEQLQKAIKQLEETGLKINVDDAGAIRKNIEDIERLRTILADTQHSDSFVEKVVKDAEEGKASVVELEKAIAMTKEKLRHTKDANMAEKLKENLDVLNPALEMTNQGFKLGFVKRGCRKTQCRNFGREFQYGQLRIQSRRTP